MEGAEVSEDVVVVTGAANGIGRAVAERFVAEGRTVIGVDRTQPHPPVSFDLVERDLSDLDGLDVLCQEIEAHYGTLRGLVNVAGVYERLDPATFSLPAYRRVLAVDLDAPLLLAVAAAEMMAVRGFGRVVNVTSIHGEFGERGGLAYDVAKGGLNQGTRTLAIEYANRGVLFNAVAPGFVETNMAMVDGVLETRTADFRRVYIEGGKLPVGRAAQPGDIAGIIAWLCSPDNTYLTGQVLRVDGGLSVTF
jgi:NAD(P)-dependent dehydrogenase (short-subunit alcohol dehydrogenase family)